MKDRDLSHTEKMFQSDMGSFDKVKKMNPPSFYGDPNMKHGMPPPMGYPPMHPNPMMYGNPYMQSPPGFYGHQQPPPPYYYDPNFYKPPH